MPNKYQSFNDVEPFYGEEIECTCLNTFKGTYIGKTFFGIAIQTATKPTKTITIPIEKTYWKKSVGPEKET